jgi:hypothetical protein
MPARRAHDGQFTLDPPGLTVEVADLFEVRAGSV